MCQIVLCGCCDCLTVCGYVQTVYWLGCLCTDISFLVGMFVDCVLPTE